MFKWISNSVAQLDRFDTVGNGWREGEGDRERERALVNRLVSLQLSPRVIRTLDINYFKLWRRTCWRVNWVAWFQHPVNQTSCYLKTIKECHDVLVSNWISTSSQPHRVASGRPNCHSVSWISTQVRNWIWTSCQLHRGNWGRSNCHNVSVSPYVSTRIWTSCQAYRLHPRTIKHLS